AYEDKRFSAHHGIDPFALGRAFAQLVTHGRIALPQSPERRRPDRSSRAVREARDRVLERAAASGIFPADEIDRAKHEAGRPCPYWRRMRRTRRLPLSPSGTFTA